MPAPPAASAALLAPGPDLPLLARMRAERLESALRARSIGLRLPGERRAFAAVLLTSGTALLSSPAEGGAPRALAAPCLLWAPVEGARTLRLEAGATGALLLLGEDMLAMAIGHNPESAELNRLARSESVAPLDGRPAVEAECLSAFGIMSRELAQPGPGSESLVEGQARALLVHLWRLVAAGEGGHAGAGAAPRGLRHLHRFRQLVEMHFRDRWTVARYAAELGLSADALHDLCRRRLGRSPSGMIRDRQMHEARLLLERSTLTVDQIAAALGFADAPQFSRFFAARAGHPPGRYRRLAAAGRGAAGTAGAGYADWP